MQLFQQLLGLRLHDVLRSSLVLTRRYQGNGLLLNNNLIARRRGRVLDALGLLSILS